MTHYSVAIIVPPTEANYVQDYVEEKMRPYDQEITVAPYVSYSIEQAAQDIATDIQRLERAIARNDPMYCLKGCREAIEMLKSQTPEQWYQERIENSHIFDDDGRPLSTDNPNGKWDWYVIGGRWDGWINDRDAHSESPDDNITSTENAIARRKIPNAIITPNGVWHDCRVLLTEREHWENDVIAIFTRYPGHQVIIVDAHI